nr:MAG TPA: hypothetical protein [Caudoviricetes sp.]
MPCLRSFLYIFFYLDHVFSTSETRLSLSLSPLGSNILLGMISYEKSRGRS